jgi:enamine deaminase RidA (YjgF/YER057c/UK114 family)
MSTIEDRLSELGVTVPDPSPAGGLYTSVVVDGDVAYTSGVVGLAGEPLALVHPGRLGDDVSIDDGRASARAALVGILGNLKGALGDLDRIERFLRLVGYVRATSEFADVPRVMDGASELLRDVWGAALLPARTTVGVAALPFGASVEIDAIVKLRA